MTIKMRLFWSNILMILVPVVSTVLVGLLCVGILWLFILGGAGLDVDDREDFDHASMAVAETAEKRVESGRDPAALEGLLDANGMSMTIMRNGQVFYSYGDAGEDDSGLISAADALGDSGSLTRGGRSLYFRAGSADGEDYRIYIFGGSDTERSFADIKTGLTISAVLIALTIFLSILLTNRFLIRFMFRRIETPLNILTEGVHEIRDGNLDYRIVYESRDEFAPVCEDFNEMAARLKASVERIQQQEASRRQLVAGISHDIRSPLTSISAYVEGLLDGVARTPELQKRYLSTIKKKADELNHIVSQLFLFSKMELEEYPENPRLIPLDETIADIVSAIREEYSGKGLDIVTDMEAVSLNADPVQIERITMNILENSLKYKEKERGRAVISLRRHEDRIRWSFADDGPGVPSAALPHLFEVFYRSDPARQQPDKGSGLGLAIVANAVRHMGGTAEALRSEEGGLEIRMEFPLGGSEHGEDTDC